MTLAWVYFYFFFAKVEPDPETFTLYIPQGSFFGLPFKDETNHNYMRSRFGISAGGSDGGVLGDSSSGSEGWGDTWYPNVPQQMWTDKGGNLLNMSSTWVQKGFGIPRDGCTLKDSWDAWLCPYRNYSRIVIENMDADNKIRRISPVALSADGYTKFGDFI